jgi:predicted transcriptional regulator
VGEGDIDALPGLVAHLEETKAAIEAAVAALRREPHSYSSQQIADRLGVSRQAVQKRWRHLGTDRQAGGQPTRLR